MGIRKYNDMKEHSISRIHSIRHPSLVNTHQSLCAHNLITKHVAAAKQPPYFRRLLPTQTRGDGCLYSGKKKLSTWGAEGLFTCATATLQIDFFFVSQPLSVLRSNYRAFPTHLPLDGNYGCDLVNSQQSFHFKSVALHSRNTAIAWRRAAPVLEMTCNEHWHRTVDAFGVMGKLDPWVFNAAWSLSPMWGSAIPGNMMGFSMWSPVVASFGQRLLVVNTGYLCLD